MVLDVYAVHCLAETVDQTTSTNVPNKAAIVYFNLYSLASKER
jgi:hypothetical protein